MRMHTPGLTRVNARAANAAAQDPLIQSITHSTVAKRDQPVRATRHYRAISAQCASRDPGRVCFPSRCTCGEREVYVSLYNINCTRIIGTKPEKRRIGRYNSERSFAAAAVAAAASTLSSKY